MKLGGHFAVAAWPFAIEHNMVTNFGTDAAGNPISLVKALRNSTETTQLKLSVAHFFATNDDVEDIVEGLPSNLEPLDR